MLGKTLAHYKISAKLGEGGMGAVYRALDSKLNRDVALKLLPQEFAKDAERLARFQREARTLASLSHPNIAPIFDIEEAGGERFLVMELIEGDDLSQRLQSGPLPLDEALDIAKQIAEGLKAAHDKSIVHRDLKPANIKISPDGKVKILDFGLARGFGDDSDSKGDSMNSPTITALHTQAGVIIGTAAYMSPEQARGLQVDKRTDIWAFGAVLFEMLSGRQLFEGGTVTDKLASILKSQPDWQQLPSNTPPRIRELLERCLAKRRRDRMQDIGDVHNEIDWTLQGRTGAAANAAATGRRLPVLPTILGAIALAVVVALATWKLNPGGGDGSTQASNAFGTRQLSLHFPTDLRVLDHLVAPDGTLGIVARPRQSESSVDNDVRLYTRDISSYALRLVPGSAGVRGFCFSHDSKWIALLAPDGTLSSSLHLWKIPVDQSSPALRLLSWPDEWTSDIHWLQDGDLVVSTHNQELIRIPTDGQGPQAAVEIHSSDFAEQFSPNSSYGTELPDGIHLLSRVEVWSDDSYAQHIAVANVETGEARVVLQNASNPRWLDTGHLLFSRGNTILAVRFDPIALEVQGGPVAVADGLRTAAAWSHGGFGVSRQGDLFHQPGGLVGQHRQLAWTDRGFEQFSPWSEERRAYERVPSISPDNRHLATIIAAANGVYETWISEVSRPSMRRFAYEKGRDCSPELWTPDAKQLIYRSYTPGSTRYMTLSVDGGTPSQLVFEFTSQTEYFRPTSFADDGALLLVTRTAEGKSQILLQPFTEDPAAGVPTQQLLADASAGMISPDGNWLAYESATSGRDDVYLRRWLGDGQLGREIRVSTEGGVTPFWYQAAADAPLEIWYDHNGKVYAVTLTTTPEASLSRPRLVVELTAPLQGFNILRDGRFLALLGGEDEVDPGRLHVVLHWKNDIRRLLNASP